MNGYLTLNANPTQALHAATKQYVDDASSALVAGAGLIRTGNTFDIQGATGRIVVQPDNIDLATTGTAGTYTKVTTDAYGRVTSGSNPTTLVGYGITDAATSTHNHSLDSLNNVTITSNASGELLKWNGTAWVNSTLAEAGIQPAGAYLTGNQTISVTGDATGSGATAIALTLANSGVAAGTYKSVTVDAKGRVTAGSNPNTLAGYGIIDGVKKNGDTMTGLLTLSGDPTDPYHAATKQYVDNAVTGLDFKGSVKVATTANITLSGTQTIDGVALIAGDRVLVKDQNTPSQNGIYVVSATAWNRSTDADLDAEVTTGFYCFVEQGATNGTTGWVLSTSGPITVGTTGLSFTQFTGLGQVTAGNGLTQSGNQLDVVGTAGRIVVNANNIDLGTTGTAGTYTKVTTDAYGRVSSGTNPTTLAGYGITDAATSTHNHTVDGLSNVTITSKATNDLLKWNGTAWVNFAPTYISGNQTISVTGDATGSGATSIALTLANSGVVSGTYKSVTVDSKGRVTAGSNPTTLAGYGITDAVSTAGGTMSGLLSFTDSGWISKTSANGTARWLQQDGTGRQH